MKKRSKAMTGSKNPMWGKHGSENPNYGKKLSKEQKQHLREINLGKKAF